MKSKQTAGSVVYSDSDGNRCYAIYRDDFLSVWGVSVGEFSSPTDELACFLYLKDARSFIKKRGLPETSEYMKRALMHIRGDRPYYSTNLPQESVNWALNWDSDSDYIEARRNRLLNYKNCKWKGSIR